MAAAPKSTEVLQMIRAAIAAKMPGTLDPTAGDKILDGVPTPVRGKTAFSVAAHPTAADRLDEARCYGAMVGGGDQGNDWWQSFALAALRDRYPRDAASRPAAEKKGAPGEKKGPGS